jgi:uncharacterized tellurite resistance protein B-like protein
MPPRSRRVNSGFGPGSLRPQQPDVAVVERVAPMCELLYLMMQHDGVCGIRERQVLRGVARTLSDGALTNTQIDELIAKFDELLLEYGPEERIFDVTEALSVDRVVAESAYTLAATMTLADDQLVITEAALLDSIAQLLGISKRRAAELSEATSQR